MPHDAATKLDSKADSSPQKKLTNSWKQLVRWKVLHLSENVCSEHAAVRQLQDAVKIIRRVLLRT